MGLSVDVADGPLAAGKIGRGHPVIAAHVHLQPTACGWVEIVVVKLVEPVPPVQVVFGQIGLAILPGHGPGPGDHQIALHGGHGPVGPAGAPDLALNWGDVVDTVYIAQVEGAGRVGLAGAPQKQGEGESCERTGFHIPVHISASSLNG